MAPFKKFIKSFVYPVLYTVLLANFDLGFKPKNCQNMFLLKWHTVVATSSFILPAKKLHSYKPIVGVVANACVNIMVKSFAKWVIAATPGKNRWILSITISILGIQW